MDVILQLTKAKNFYTILPHLTETQLVDTIKIASDSYYNDAISLINDEIYDALVDRLRSTNPKSAVLQQIGAPARGKKVKLPYWMGSMNKIKNDDNLIRKWCTTHNGPYMISDKLDGISCLLTANNGVIKLYTRGDGDYGQDVSHLLKYINASVSQLRDSRQKIAIRGEFIMTKQKFKKYETQMSNARNMAGGIINSKPESVNVGYARDIDLVMYEIIEPAIKPSNQIKMLKKLCLNVVYYDIYEDIDASILDKILQIRKKKSIYEIDGIIITNDSLHSRNQSGNPTYSFAYKGTSATANVKVLEVLWRTSKDGYLVPRIHFEKVRLSQADLEYATGFNAKFIEDNQIGVGAIITVVRSGDVIPYILAVIKPATKSGLPKSLSYKWDKSHVNIILNDYESHKSVIIQRLTKFVRNIHAKDISEGIVSKLVDNNFDSVLKIISMTQDDFLSLPGFQSRLAKKIYNNIQSALENLDILTLMDASNIFGRGFGSRKIKKILNVYPNIVADYKLADRVSWNAKLLNLEGFDTITTNKFLNALPDFQQFYKLISKKIHIKPFVTSKLNTNSIFANCTIVFTGFRSKDWQKFIEDNGGHVTTSVSKNTSLVVYNDGDETTAKVVKARELGIDMITKSQFEKKFINKKI